MRTDADEAISEDSSGCGSTLITSSTDDGVSRAEAHMRATLDGEREQCDVLTKTVCTVCDDSDRSPAAVCPHGSQPRPPESGFSTPATVGDDSGFLTTTDCTVCDDSDRSDIAADLHEKVRAGGCAPVSDDEGLRTDADRTNSEDSSGFCSASVASLPVDSGEDRAEAHMCETSDGVRIQGDDLQAAIRAGRATRKVSQDFVMSFLTHYVDDRAPLEDLVREIMLAFDDLSRCITSATSSDAGAKPAGSVRQTRAERRRKCDEILGCTARVEQLVGQLLQC